MTEDCSCAFVVYPGAGFNKRGNRAAGSPSTLSLALQTER